MTEHETYHGPREVVVLDDEAAWLTFFLRLNRRHISRFLFRTFTVPDEALRYARASNAKGNLYAAFVDIELQSDRNGLDFIRSARDAGVLVPYIIYTQYAESDLESRGLGINSILGQDISYFVEKDRLQFDDNQNVDKITESARDRYDDSLRRAIQEYARRNFVLLTNWRDSLSSVVADLDRAILYNKRGESVNRRLIRDKVGQISIEKSKVTNLRFDLVTLMGKMQTDHVNAAKLAFNERNLSPSSSAVSTESRNNLDFHSAMLYSTKILELYSQKPEADSANDHYASRDQRLRFVKQIGLILGGMKPYPKAIAISLAIEELVNTQRADASLDLALGAADYFSVARDPNHEVTFATIAARICEQLGDVPAKELCVRRAERVARSSGSLSLQLEILPNDAPL